MLEKQYSVQFFTSLVESMQKVCREYLQFDQAVELSGYLSLEIDNTKRERYVVSEMLQNTGNVISESYCTKAFKTLPSVAAKKPDSSREVLRELSERLHDQPYLTSPPGADPRNIQGYSRQLASRSGSGSGQDTPSFSNQHRARTNNSFPHTDVSQDHHEQFSYLPADWGDSPSVHPHGASLGVAVSHIPPSVSNSCDRLALPTVKRRTMQILPTTEPKKGKLSSGEPHTEVLSSGNGHGEGLSPVFSNSQHNNEQSVYCTNSDSQPSLTNSLSHTNSLHNTCNIKTERDSSVHFVQVDSLEDSNGLSDVSEEQFRTLTMGNTKSTHENLQLQSTQINPGIWDTGDPSHEVELFKNQPQCNNCGMMYLSEAGLMFHKCRSSNMKGTIKCPTCSKTFYNRQSMKRHQAVHNPLKPYSCDVCGAKFSSKTAMTQHIKYRHQNMQPSMTMSCVYDVDSDLSKLESK